MAVQYTSIKPLGDRVLVKIKTVEEKTDGGILLPTTAQTKPQAGEVVAVGEGKTVGKAKLDISVKVVFRIGLSFLFSVFFQSLDFQLIYLLLCLCSLGPKSSIPSMQGLSWSSMAQIISY